MGAAAAMAPPSTLLLAAMAGPMAASLRPSPSTVATTPTLSLLTLRCARGLLALGGPPSWCSVT